VILNGFHDGSALRAILPLAERCKWIHALSAGVEKVLSHELVESPIPLTNGKGVFGPALAEFAIAGMLYFAKDLRRLIRQQAASRWEQFDVAFLRDQTLGVVGYGGIGRETARLAHALGMKVLAVRRRPPSPDENDPILERSFAREQLSEMLGLSDYIVAAAPLTPETQGMLNHREFHFMKSSAVFINVGRGAVVVEEALISALNQNLLRGAALDVCETEPLPPDHPFYRMENVLLSPHCADHTTGWMELAVKQFMENFERFRNGQPLEFLVDKSAGY
jgi:phosphoglycerate dehydrogenase-like enzyme